MALALGRTVAELETNLSSAELSEWLAFYSLEPFGPLQDDFRAGQIAAVTANAWGSAKEPYRADDFFPHLRPLRRQSEAEIETRLRLALGIAANVVEHRPD